VQRGDGDAAAREGVPRQSATAAAAVALLAEAALARHRDADA
jgi:hypothetical protein